MPERITQQQFERSIELIYNAAIAPDSWQPVVDYLSEICDRTYACIYAHDNIVNFNTGMIYSMYDDDLMKSYVEYYSSINPYLPGVAASPIGRAVAGHEYCPDDVLMKSEMYNDWIRSQDDVGAGGGLTLFRDARRMVVVGGNISFKRREKLEDKWLDTLDLLAPHLLNAFNITRIVEGRSLESHVYGLAAQHFDTGIFLVASDMRVLFANQAGHKLIETGRFLKLSLADRLSFADGLHQETFASAVRGGTYATFRARTSQGLDDYVCSVSPHDGQLMSTDAIFQRTRAEKFYLLAVRPMASRQDLGTELIKRYKLTPAETAIALSILEGKDARQISEERRSRESTVRKQIKSVLHKTESRRQVDLVSKLERLRQR